MKNQGDPKKASTSSRTEDPDPRAIKRRGDTAVHCAVSDNDPVTLRSLIKSGLRVFNQSDADGATPLHRAAENCSIDCARILLEQNADIDALNFSAQTSFHVAAEKQDFIFGRFLLKNRARKNCRSGCVKCRLFVKQIERLDKQQKEQEQIDKAAKLEEQKMSVIDAQDSKLVEDLSKLNLQDELRKCKEEFGGPFFSKKENQKLRQQQAEELRLEEEGRQRRMMLGGRRNPFEIKSSLTSDHDGGSSGFQQFELIKPQEQIKPQEHIKPRIPPQIKGRHEITKQSQGEGIHRQQAQIQSQVVLPYHPEPILIKSSSEFQARPANLMQQESGEDPPDTELQLHDERKKRKKNKRKRRVDEEEEKKRSPDLPEDIGFHYH